MDEFGVCLRLWMDGIYGFYGETKSMERILKYETKIRKFRLWLENWI